MGLIKHARLMEAAERRRLTNEALADVKAGRTHKHAVIKAWAAKLDQPKRKARR